MTILVVDDSEDVRDIVEAVLAKAGYQDVVAVDSAAAAIAYLARESETSAKPSPVDLVLLDVLMPDMDGIETCARIRSNPRYADVPIVMASSCDDIGSVDDAFKWGATDYLTKPLKAVDLLACVRSKLKLKADLDRRTAREHELQQHVPFRF
jgi:phosphoserine phosphatase RsbU/P